MKHLFFGLVLTVLFALSGAEPLLKTASAGLLLKDKNLILLNRYPDAEWKQAPIRFTLDFASAPHYEKHPAKLPEPVLKTGPGPLQLNYAAAGWKWNNRISIRNRVILVDAEFTNTSKKLQLIETGAELLPDFRAADFWNGYGKSIRRTSSGNGK